MHCDFTAIGTRSEIALMHAELRKDQQSPAQPKIPKLLQSTTIERGCSLRVERAKPRIRAVIFYFGHANVILHYAPGKCEIRRTVSIIGWCVNGILSHAPNSCPGILFSSLRGLS